MFAKAVIKSIFFLDKELCELNEATLKYAEIQKQLKRVKAELVEKKINLQVLATRQSEEEHKSEYLKKIRLYTMFLNIT